jgi:glycosyltransferase involved in cell wall biosynthesis
MRTTTLSIITVCYNDNEGLKQTLRSIQIQSFTDYEHIIIDGGSTDGSTETIRSYADGNPHVTYWHSQPDKGIYDGMNIGIAHASGIYLNFMNAGDCFADDVLAKINFDGSGYLYGDAEVIRPKRRYITHAPEQLDLIELCREMPKHQSCFIRRNLFDKHLYPTDYKIIADWAHFFRSVVMEHCTYHHLPIVVSVCDGSGISMEGHRELLEEEHRRWFKENTPELFADTLITCRELAQSEFRPVIDRISLTHKFQKRMVRLVMQLVRLRNLIRQMK